MKKGGKKVVGRREGRMKDAGPCISSLLEGLVRYRGEGGHLQKFSPHKVPLLVLVAGQVRVLEQTSSLKGSPSHFWTIWTICRACSKI